jgi:hypothetical protein
MKWAYLSKIEEAAKAKAAKVEKPSGREKGSMPALDPEEWPPIKGMEGPFRYKSGRVLYYDPKEGAYYDSRKDIYLDKSEKIEDIETEKANREQVSKISDDEAMITLNRILAQSRAELTQHGFDVSWDQGDGVGLWSVSIKRTERTGNSDGVSESVADAINCGTFSDGYRFARKRMERLSLKECVSFLVGLTEDEIQSEWILGFRASVEVAAGRPSPLVRRAVRLGLTEETAAISAGPFPIPLGSKKCNCADCDGECHSKSEDDGDEEEEDEEDEEDFEESETADETRLFSMLKDQSDKMVLALANWEAKTLDRKTPRFSASKISEAADKVRKAAARVADVAGSAAKDKNRIGMMP